MPDNEGEFGYLTTAQWRAFQWAVSHSVVFVPFLYAAGNYSINDPDEARAKSADVPLGMPATMIAAIEIDRIGQEMREWDDIEDVANDVYGAEVAKMFTREVQTAAHRWPIADEPHRVEYIRCQACGFLALDYHPPATVETDAVVQCGECGNITTGDDFKMMAELFAREYQEAKLAG